VGRAPDVFKFAADTGCARAVSQSMLYLLPFYLLILLFNF
jgi:hypothetical protein